MAKKKRTATLTKGLEAFLKDKELKENNAEAFNKAIKNAVKKPASK